MYKRILIGSWTRRANILTTTAIRRSHVTTSETSVTEIEIPVPWGIIAGKLWNGSQEKQPILAIHGWQDNSGSFDALVPLLSDTGPILAIDMPGHGFSSRLPAGIPYTEMINVTLIHRLKKHYGWEKVKLLGHSLGSICNFLYASIYPEKTKFLISLDALKYHSINVPKFNAHLAKAINQLFQIEKFLYSDPPSYTERDIIERWIKATRKSVDEKAVRRLMVRGTSRKSDGTYFFNRDPRLKLYMLNSGFTHNHLQELARLITSPYMVVKAIDSPYFEDDKKYFYDIVDILKGTSKDFYYVRVPGGHHVHLVHPEVVAEAINPFLQKYNN